MPVEPVPVVVGPDEVVCPVPLVTVGKVPELLFDAVAEVVVVVVVVPPKELDNDGRIPLDV